MEVDRATGEITIRRFVCVEDTGRIINPLIVEGQVHGAIAQGIAGPPAALANAVADALGVEVNDLPITSARAWTQLDSASSSRLCSGTHRVSA